MQRRGERVSLPGHHGSSVTFRHERFEVICEQTVSSFGLKKNAGLCLGSKMKLRYCASARNFCGEVREIVIRVDLYRNYHMLSLDLPVLGIGDNLFRLAVSHQ